MKIMQYEIYENMSVFYPSRTPVFTSAFMVRSKLLIFLVLCVWFLFTWSECLIS